VAEGSFEQSLTRAREELRALAAAAEEAKTRSATGTAAHDDLGAGDRPMWTGLRSDDPGLGGVTAPRGR
jgi:hypothetical protein